MAVMINLVADVIAYTAIIQRNAFICFKLRDFE